MNKLAMAVATVSLLLSTHSQAATIIQDTFWGSGKDGIANSGTDSALPEMSGDVYGGPMYDIDSAEATLTQNLLTVVIKSSLYFSSWINGRTDYAPGDLYLSTTGWSPAGDASRNYNTDDSTNGTAWNYVISLSGIDSDNLSGDATLYKTADAADTADGKKFIYGYLRPAQEVWSPFEDGTTSYGTGGWRYQTESNDEISLLIEMNLSDLLGDDWNGTTPLGFHFTMDCGNDVLEGSIAPVPLPSTCLLLGSALVGLMGVARRRVR